MVPLHKTHNLQFCYLTQSTVLNQPIKIVVVMGSDLGEMFYDEGMQLQNRVDSTRTK